jgi:hypothetical protein
VHAHGESPFLKVSIRPFGNLLRKVSQNPPFRRKKMTVGGVEGGGVEGEKK